MSSRASVVAYALFSVPSLAEYERSFLRPLLPGDM